MAPFHASHDRMADLTFLLLIHRRAKIQDNGTHVSIEREGGYVGYVLL